MDGSPAGNVSLWDTTCFMQSRSPVLECWRTEICWALSSGPHASAWWCFSGSPISCEGRVHCCIFSCGRACDVHVFVVCVYHGDVESSEQRAPFELLLSVVFCVFLEQISWSAFSLVILIAALLNVVASSFNPRLRKIACQYVSSASYSSPSSIHPSVRHKIAIYCLFLCVRLPMPCAP